MNARLDSIDNQALALAGIFQATWQVRELAWQGRSDEGALCASLGSLFKLDASDVDDIFGSREGLLHGLQILVQQLGGDAERRDLDISRYSVTLLHLENKLHRDGTAMQRIHDDILRARETLQQFPLDHPNMSARLAEIYSQTISPMSPRIMVNGSPLHLGDADTASRIRALLLAGIRSAVLWRQCGGTRFRLLWRRSRYINAAQRMLAEIDG